MEVARRGRRHVAAVEGDLARGRLPQPHDRLDQLVLAVAGHPGDAEDLAGADLEAHTVDHLVPSIVGDPERPRPENDAGRLALATVDGELDVAADHQLGQVLLVRLGRDARADDLAAPDDRDAVGDVEDLVELVADEDDRGSELAA